MAKTETKADLATALRSVSDNRLGCRGMRHAWKISRDFYVYTQVQEKGRKTMHFARDFECMRGCGVTVREVFIQDRFGRIERIKRSTDYPAGYQLQGVPRGVKPQAIVNQEMFRRAMEKVAGAAPGERERGD